MCIMFLLNNDLVWITWLLLKDIYIKLFKDAKENN